MVGTEGRPEDPKRASVKRFRLVLTTLARAKNRKVVDGRRNVRVVKAEQCLLDPQRARVEDLGLVRVAARRFERTEVVAVDRELIVVGAERGLEGRDRPSVELLGLLQAPLFLHQRRKSGDIGCDGG